MDSADNTVSTFADELSVPRKNGEPVFDLPWQARAFGIVVSMWQDGTFPWSEFKTRLIAEIERDSCHEQPDNGNYYHHFAAALHSLALEKGLVTQSELEHRVQEQLIENDHGHDHDDDHGNGHSHAHHHH